VRLSHRRRDALVLASDLINKSIAVPW
jgi:hypothetical protein